MSSVVFIFSVRNEKEKKMSWKSTYSALGSSNPEKREKKEVADESYSGDEIQSCLIANLFIGKDLLYIEPYSSLFVS